ncbi:MAG: type II toxin-antitoxin system PemK/MazF family toxin [Arcobacter sp.]|nr:type II toxin-antitoxin system PemK/MazF family toxin [Arcobacter sp.]
MSFCKYLKYKARPAVILSSETYNQNKRDTLIILAVSSSLENKLDIEFTIQDWKKAGLLKPSILKSAIATIEKDFVVASWKIRTYRYSKSQYYDRYNLLI